ncbi:MAG: hypothetical protein MO852_08635 [Candidatus Devosia euplotis]|nr:hypothetical protein [Candidatus Devosia euplotis]
MGNNLAVKPTAAMAAIAVGGVRLHIDDADVTVASGGGRPATSAGTIVVSNPAVVIDSSDLSDRIVEISGDISGAIPAMLDLVKTQQPALLAHAELPIDVTALSGLVDAGMVATIHLPDEATGRAMTFDYVLNGTVADFASSKPIEKQRIGNGQLEFSASQDGYQLGGTAEIDGIVARLEIGGKLTTDPVFRLSSTMGVAELAKMGFDTSAFLSGSVRVVAQPMPDGTLQMALDITDAGLAIEDLGIGKVAGTSGTVSVTIRQDGELTQLSGVDLSFGAVRALGISTTTQPKD